MRPRFARSMSLSAIRFPNHRIRKTVSKSSGPSNPVCINRRTGDRQAPCFDAQNRQESNSSREGRSPASVRRSRQPAARSADDVFADGKPRGIAAGERGIPQEAFEEILTLTLHARPLFPSERRMISLVRRSPLATTTVAASAGAAAMLPNVRVEKRRNGRVRRDASINHPEVPALESPWKAMISTVGIEATNSKQSVAEFRNAREMFIDSDP